MKYMLLMNFPYGKWSSDSIFTWPEKDARAHIDCLRRINEELNANGEYVTAQGLAVPDEAKIVRARGDGPPEVTDGPFPEAKEFLAGYWILDLESIERAVEVAARASAAPGRGGKPLNMPIEVRQIMGGPSSELG
jgi:hypothetical protein